MAMVGDKACLSGRAEPSIIPRPCCWESGETIPKHYIRKAEKLLHRNAKETGSLLKLMLWLVGIGGSVMPAVIVAFAFLAHDFSILTWALLPLLGMAAAMAFLIFLLHAVKQNDSSRSSALQQRRFEWRTGKLDDVVSVLTGYKTDTDGTSEPEYEISAYADGEQLRNILLEDTRFSTVKNFRSQLAVKKTGKMNLGDDVVLLRVGAKVLILPLDNRFSEQ